MRNLLTALATCRRAATAVEYGLIVSLIVISMIVAFKTLASVTVDMWNNVNSAVNNAQ